MNSKTHREKMTQIMFGAFSTPAMYVGILSDDGVRHTVPTIYGVTIFRKCK